MIRVSYLFVFSFAFMIANSQSKEELNLFDSLLLNRLNITGKEIPAFTIQASNGIKYSNNNLNGKVTLINFWFEACTPCIAEMDALNKLYELYKVRQNFQFISITFENLKQLSRILGEYKIKYPVVSTTQDSCYYLNFKSGFPATIITGKDGKVAYFTLGGVSEKEKANTYFKNLIYPKLDSLLR